MAHEIDFTTGKAAMAFTGDRSAIWHGLGSNLSKDASIEEWTKEAGFDWDVKETPVLFRGLDGEIISSNDKKVLYRSDTGSELSVVGKDYKVVQPKEVLEFFRDIVDGTGAYLDTAAILLGGRRFFASANTSMMDYVGKKEDTIFCNLILATSVDSTLASNIYASSVRPVCQNTLNLSMRSEKKNHVKVSHRTTFNPETVKSQMAMLDENWGLFIENLNKMASKSVDDSTAFEIYKELVYVDKANPTTQAVNQVDLLMSLYKNGKGAEMTYGNMYGVLQGVTECVDWHSRNRTEDSKVMNKFYGKGADLKQSAFDLLLEIA